MKIAIASVFVNDSVTAHQFYTEVLGFTSKLFLPEQYVAIVTSPQSIDGTSLLLEPNENPIAKAYQQGLFSSGIPAITFSAADLEKETARLKNAGVKFKKDPARTAWGFEAIFDDSCGNYIQLVEE